MARADLVQGLLFFESAAPNARVAHAWSISPSRLTDPLHSRRTLVFDLLSLDMTLLCYIPLGIFSGKASRRLCTEKRRFDMSIQHSLRLSTTQRASVLQPLC